MNVEYARVKAGFVAKGTSLNQWCRAHSIKRQNASKALLSQWSSPAARELRTKLLKESGVAAPDEDPAPAAMCTLAQADRLLVVRRFLAGTQTRAEAETVAQEAGIHVATLYRWIAEAPSAGAVATPVALADAVRDALAGPALGGLLTGLLDALGKGYSAVELLWQTDRTPWTPTYVWRDPRFFRYDRDTGQTLLLAPTLSGDGQPLPPYRFIVHQPRLKLGLPIRGGLARLCAATHLCGIIALEDWLLFAEVFGMPLRVGRYGTSAEDIDLLKTAVAGLGHDDAAVLHESMRIEFQAAAPGAGGADLYERLLGALHKLVSKAVLGRSDAADATSGKLGNEQASSEVRRDNLESDAEELSATLNAQLVRPFIDLNFGPQQRYPTLKLYVPNQEDLAGLVDMLAKLVPLGLKVEQSVIRDKFSLPDPKEGAELLTPVLAEARAWPAPTPAVNRALNQIPPNPPLQKGGGKAGGISQGVAKPGDFGPHRPPGGPPRRRSRAADQRSARSGASRPG